MRRKNPPTFHHDEVLKKRYRRLPVSRITMMMSCTHRSSGFLLLASRRWSKQFPPTNAQVSRGRCRPVDARYFVSSSSHPLVDYDDRPSKACQTLRYVEAPSGRTRINSVTSLGDAVNLQWLQRVRSITQLEELVLHLEKWQPHIPLTQHDMKSYTLPLVSLLCQKRHNARGAELANHVLLNCLARLPLDIPQRLQSRHDYDIPVKLYHDVMRVWGDQRSLSGAQRAQQVFDMLQHEYQGEQAWMDRQHHDEPGLKYQTRSPAPDRESYITLLRAWVVSGDAVLGPTRAYQILQDMEDRSGVAALLNNKISPNQIGHMRPNRLCYNLVLSALAQVPVEAKPKGKTSPLVVVRNIVTRMDSIHETFRKNGATEMSNDYILDGFSYQSILRAYSQAMRDRHHNVTLQDVETVLRRIRQQDAMLLCACGRSVWDDLSPSFSGSVWIEALLGLPFRSPDELESRLEQVEQVIASLSGDRADLDLLPVSVAAKRGKATVWPTQGSIKQTINVLSRLHGEDADARVAKLIDVAVRAPFQRSYELNAAMETWLQSSLQNRSVIVEGMLMRALDSQTSLFRPTGQSFAIAMKAWLQQASNDDAPYRAELLFKILWDCFELTNDPYFCPRGAHIRFVLLAWLQRVESRKRYRGLAGDLYAAEHIERLVLWVRDCDWMQNYSGHHAMALRAWAKHKSSRHDADAPDPLLHVTGLIDDMEHKLGELPAFPCNWGIQACARPQKSEKQRSVALRLAFDIYRRASPNARTFVIMLHVLKNQKADIHNDEIFAIVAHLLRDCCSRGLLQQEIIWQIVDIANEMTLQKLFGVSYQYATSVLQARHARLRRQKSELLWVGPLPRLLAVVHMPSTWSENASL